ncbi:MAG: molecular chaperone DnaJ [Phenylobacterium sp.]|nr:MAG: molecular chaperone DnaJ [Phenylobacterium sp.]
MIYLILGCAVLLVLVAAGRRGGPIRIRREWRYLTAAGAIAAFVAAVVLILREAWLPAVLLLVLGLSLMASARVDTRKRPAPVRERMSADEARSILGVGPEATTEEIQAAYTRLMRLAHPDKGGTTGLASQLNAARDRLLRK